MSVFTTGKLGHPSRILAAIVLCGTFAFIIPSSSVANTTDSDDKTRKRMETNEEDGVDWQAIRTTDPDEWSDELRAQLVSAGYDVDRIAARVRAGQADAVKREAMTTPQEEWSEDLIQKLLDLCQENSGNFNPIELANILWALATLGVNNPTVIEILASRAADASIDFHAQGVANTSQPGVAIH